MEEIGRRVSSGGTDEFAMVEFLAEAMRREGLVWEHGPNVSSGPNSADSHYEPTAANSKPIRRGDFVLIDIWGKVNRPDACYYDITWTGVVGREPTPREQMVFEVVRNARDAAVKVVEEAFASGAPIAGWQARRCLARCHRPGRSSQSGSPTGTGHNIGPVLHGNGANLDNLETHDERLILPKTCFSVEPGLYFPGEFGVRSEVDMIALPGSAKVTGRIQTELVRI